MTTRPDGTAIYRDDFAAFGDEENYRWPIHDATRFLVYCIGSSN